MMVTGNRDDGVTHDETMGWQIGKTRKERRTMYSVYDVCMCGVMHVESSCEGLTGKGRIT